jgi:flagellar hook-associated protein 1 FlgK
MGLALPQRDGRQYTKEAQMSGLFGVLSIGKSALLTEQLALNVTGHNIANVNTDGYSRQKVVMETNTPIAHSPGMLGQGVHAVEIKRIHNRFIDEQLYAETQNLGRWDAEADALGKLEMIYDISGLSETLCGFWNAWEDLANNPTGATERVILVNTAETLASGFNKVYDDIVSTQEGAIADSISGTIVDINGITRQIAELNKKIFDAEVDGSNANDYRDQRDLLLRELSEYIDFENFEDNQGRVTILTANGNTLVQDFTSWEMGTQTVSGQLEVTWIDGAGTARVITQNITGGKLKGWIEGGLSSHYLDRLNVLFEAIRDEVNALHSTGYGLDGSTGIDFFSGTTAGDMRINPLLASDTNRIAAARLYDEVPGDKPGDNSNALAIASLRDSLVLNDNTASIADYYASIIGELGSDVNEASSRADFQEDMVTQLMDYRESISGVNLDEEMVDMIEYQRAYEAAAKVISVTDELLGTILSMI